MFQCVNALSSCIYLNIKTAIHAIYEIYIQHGQLDNAYSCDLILKKPGCEIF